MATPMRRLLLISNSTPHGGTFLEHCTEQIMSFLGKKISSVLFIPYALRDHDGYAKKARSKFEEMGYSLDSLHEYQNPLDAVNNAQAFFVGGGNTFQLLKCLYDLGILDLIQKRVLKENIPYIGSSAGTNVATINICTTNDMPIVYPPSFQAIGLVPFNINPHFIDPDPNSTCMGETREERILQYHEFDNLTPVLGLREGCMLVVEENKCKLLGTTKARLFVRNKDAVEYDVGADLSFLLS